MIPLQEQELIRERFSQEIKGRVKIDFFTRRPSSVFIPGREDCEFCPPTEQMLEELAHLSPQVDLRVRELGADRATEERYGIERVPATVIRGVVNRPVLFYGIPGGDLFPVLLEAIIAVSGDPPQPPPAARRRLKRLKRDTKLQVFVTPTAPSCAEQALLAVIIGLAGAHVRTEIIEASEFPHLAEQYGVRVVPTTLIDGRVSLTGLTDPDALVEQIVTAAEHRALPSGGLLYTGRSTDNATPIAAPPRPESGAVRPSGLIIPGR